MGSFPTDVGAPEPLPGPRLPMPVQTLLYGVWPVRWLSWCQRRYGDAFALRLPQRITLAVLTDPAAIDATFALDPADFHADAAVLEPFLGAGSLLLLDGDRHRQQRHMLSHAFHAETMANYADLVAQATRAEVAVMPRDRPFALLPHLQAITLEVIMRAVLGLDDEAVLAEFRALFRPFLVKSGSLMVLNPALRYELGGRSPYGRFVRLRREVHLCLEQEIASRWRDPELAERHDVLSLVLRAEGADGTDGSRLTDAEVRDHIMTMLLAGHDTTATALAWAFDLLLHQRDVMAQLSAELSNGDDRYLTAVVKEALRLRPVIPEIGRTLTHTTRLGAVTVPAGVTAAPSALLAHRRAEAYPDPLRFRPERFLDGAADPQPWIPFGGGNRRCLGAGFAMLEMKVVIRTLVTSVELRATHETPERPRRRVVTLVPRRGTRVVIVRAKDRY